MDSEEDFGHLDEDLDDLAPPPNRRYKTDSRYGPYSNSSGSSDSGQHRDEESDVTSSGTGMMKKNLNMMSAFTHVGGDTIRTISVLTAATVSLLSGIDGDICDAWAAIAVTHPLLLLTLSYSPPDSSLYLAYCPDSHNTKNNHQPPFSPTTIINDDN